MAQEQEQIPLKGRTQQQQEIEEIFRPFFEEHAEEEGMPLVLLKRKLHEAGVSQHIPPHKVDMLVRKADENKDGFLSYNEFMELVCMEEAGAAIRKTELTAFQSTMRTFVSSVVPNHTVRKDGTEVVEHYIDHYNCKPPPLFMILISVAEVIVFIVYAVELKNKGTPVTATSGCPLYSPLIYNPSRRYEAWRFFTYMFIHQGYTHLIFNLIFQLLLGLPLEMVHKWWRIGIVYTLGVLAGSLAHSVTDFNTLLAGASGGCYAILGAHFAIIIMNWKEMTHDWMKGPVKFLCSAPMRLIFWVLFAGIDIGITIYNRYQGEGENIGYAAHIGGALAGILLGIPVLKNIHVKPWEKVLWWVALIIYLCGVIFAVCFNTFYPHYPETDWRPCCPYPLF